MSFLYWLFLPLLYHCVKGIIAVSWADSHSQVFHHFFFFCILEAVPNKYYILWQQGMSEGFSPSQNMLSTWKSIKGNIYRLVSSSWAGSSGQRSFTHPAMSEWASSPREEARPQCKREFGHFKTSGREWSFTTPLLTVNWSYLSLSRDAGPMLVYQIFKRGC